MSQGATRVLWTLPVQRERFFVAYYVSKHWVATSNVSFCWT